MLFAIKVVYYINFDHQRVMQSQLKGLSLWNNERLYIMKVPKILNYITPQIVKYQNIDDLLENNKQRPFYDVAENLSIDKLL